MSIAPQELNLSVRKEAQTMEQPNTREWAEFVDGTYKSLLMDLPNGLDIRTMGLTVREFISASISIESGSIPYRGGKIEEDQVARMSLGEIRDITGEEIFSTFQGYAVDLFSVSAEDNHRLITLNSEPVNRLNHEMKIAKESGNLDQLGKLEVVKSLLGNAAYEYYLQVEKYIDPVKLEKYRQEVIKEINTYNEQPREQSTLLLNGFVSSGKGTTLKLLGKQAFETGTDGALGRGKGFEFWEDTTSSWDLPREGQWYVPNKIMNAIFLQGIRHARRQLDIQGNPHEPVVISGFPRSTEQAMLLEGINGIQSAYLQMGSREAVIRTLTRIIQDADNTRSDDIMSLRDGENEFYPEALQAEAARILENREYCIDNIRALFESGTIEALTRNVELSDNARYHRDTRTKGQILSALEQIGVKTTEVNVTGKSPQEVAEEVEAAFIGK
jgi:adenylate kinase family enzyme